ncbi:MAG: DUF2911 domain-containing protein [Agriterribacter sp.]
MKKRCTIAVFLVLFMINAQSQEFRKPDVSPMDAAYYPDNFAHDRKAGEKPLIKVTYSRPSKKDREIFGKLVPYGQVWRTGANEATEIKFYADAVIGGKKVKAGTYSLFTIPGEKEWTIILNTDLDYWGAYSYKQEKDVLRVTAPAAKSDSTIENFSIQFAKSDDGAIMRLGWDNTVVNVPVKF